MLLTTRSGTKEIKSSQMPTKCQERFKIVLIDSITLATTIHRNYPHRQQDAQSLFRVTLNEAAGQTTIHAISASIHSSIMVAII